MALNAEIVAVTEARGAPALEVTQTRFNDYGALLRLGRYGAARTLLATCRAVFEEEGAVEDLGKVFGALADREDELGHRTQASAFEKTALRYKYLAGGPESCAISHFNLSNYLIREGGTPTGALAHLLAAGVIFFQTGSGRWPLTRSALARHLLSFALNPPPLPESFDALCRIVEEVEGVRFRELCERLPRRAPTSEEAFATVLQEAMEEIRRVVQE